MKLKISTCELFKPFFHKLNIRIFLNVKDFARNTVETREIFRILLFKTSDKITIQKSYILFKRFLRTFHPFPDLNVFSYSTFNTGFPLLYFSIDWNIEQSKMHVVYLSFHKRNCKTFFKNLWPIRFVFNVHKIAYKWITFKVMWEKEKIILGMLKV